MIRKDVQRLSLATNAERVSTEIMRNGNPKRDGDSTWSHHASGRIAIPKPYHGTNL
jgi:hypothetical protein